LISLSDYNGQDNPTSFYGEFSICSDGPTNLNQYEKIGKIYFLQQKYFKLIFLGSSIHNLAKSVCLFIDSIVFLLSKIFRMVIMMNIIYPVSIQMEKLSMIFKMIYQIMKLKIYKQKELHQ